MSRSALSRHRRVLGLVGPAVLALGVGGTVLAGNAAATSPLPTSTTIDCNPDNPGGAGDVLGICTVTVSSPGSTTPITGTAPVTSDAAITFPFGGDFVLSPANPGGTDASEGFFTFVSTTAGTHVLTANYAGDATHAPSSTTLTVTVRPARHRTQLSLSCGIHQNSIPVGTFTACSLFATDTGPLPHSAPTGVVTFKTLNHANDLFAQESCKLVPFSASQSACMTELKPSVVGPDTVEAVYFSDTTHEPSSLDLPITVTR